MTTNQIGSVGRHTMPAAMPSGRLRSRREPGKTSLDSGFRLPLPMVQPRTSAAAGSYSWGGINNTHFWVDPKNGIGVVILTQVLPFYNDVSMDVVKRFENLEQATKHKVVDHVQPSRRAEATDRVR